MLSRSSSPHLKAVLQALLVTFLWSTSWVIIKFGLKDIPALTFAGLRYSIAFLCLLPFVFTPARLASLRSLRWPAWGRLLLLGFLFYTVTQGAQFLGLFYLPAITASLLLNFSPIAVALMGIVLLAERPTLLQWSGVALNVAGVIVYFYPISLPRSQTLGIIIITVGVLANALSSILGRRVNRDREADPLTVTVVSMGLGSILLLATGLLAEGLPSLSPLNWGYILWLAVVNTAFAFTLWNNTLRTLSAVESSIINNTMLIQIAILAWLFLGERITWQEAAGLVLAGLGSLVVQIQRRRGSV